MKKISAAFLLLILVLVHSPTAFAQQQRDRVDEQVLARIRAEGFQNSRIIDTLSYVTDVFGGRLTNSPNLKNAQEWTRERMISWGLENVQLEPWGEWGKGWSFEKFSIEMIEPTYDRLNAYPLAWTPSTNGTVSGKPVLVAIRSPADFEKYRGKLKGSIVLPVRLNPSPSESRFQTPAKRFTDEELSRAAQATSPVKEGEISGSPVTTYQDEEKDWQAALSRSREMTKFFKDEGVAALVQPSRAPNGILSVQGYYETDVNKNVPTFIVAREQYARIMRLLDRNVPVRLELNLQTRTHDDSTGYNLVGEIPGSAPRLKDEIVLLGGHFDSWHAAPGATDNATGCVVMLEALRILKAIGVKPRRTIRVALWSGEEQDYGGSLGYVKKHFGDPATFKLLPEHAKLSVYYNLDNGTGKIRGIFLQGNEATRSVFEEYLKPFQILGAKTVSILNTGGTDHMPFDAVGLPAFQFIQDPIDYMTRTHHTNLDTLEAVLEEDLKINAVIVAYIAYQTAMRDEKLPRKLLMQANPAK